MRNLASSCHLLLVFLTGVYGNRIIGGVVVDPHSIKYQVSLKYINTHFCGGTLIHPQWVVSAAHCWLPPYRIRVVVSEHNILEKDKFEQIFRVSRVIKHYRYNYWTLDSDIMLIKLERPAIINAMTEPASLPDPRSPELQYLTRCTVSGWGVTWRNHYKLSPELRSVDVKYFSDCRPYYRFRTTENMICAGDRSGGKDACQGDSGGPLVCNGKLEGIVSWGISCALAYYPGVYTKVRNYLGWMNRTIQHN